MGVVGVASGSSPSAYIRGLIREIDQGDPNGSLSDFQIIRFPNRQLDVENSSIWVPRFVNSNNVEGLPLR